MSYKKGRDDWGLVFSGGGGKGAYQIGAWKAIEELGLNITAVSGTSVGALNAALFATGTPAEGEAIWKSIDKSKILTKRSSFERIADIGKMTGKVLEETDTYGMMFGLLGGFLQEGFFSREGLVSLLRENDIARRVRESGTDCFATCYEITSEECRTFKLNDLAPSEIVKVLLASSAIPGIFPPVDLRDGIYFDGGIRDNTPVAPLYEAGYRKILVVHLTAENEISPGVFFSRTIFGTKPREENRGRFAGADIVDIYPSASLGGFKSGTMNFDPKALEKRIELGYGEVRKKLKELIP